MTQTLTTDQAEALALAVSFGQPAIVTEESELALYACSALLAGYVVSADEVAAIRSLVDAARGETIFGSLAADELAAADSALSALSA